MKITQIGNLWGDKTNFKNKTSGRVYDQYGICPALNTMQGGWKQPMIVENVIIGGMQENQSIKKDWICTTLTSSMGTGGGYVPMIPEVVRIKQATKDGYIECKVGGVADLSFPDSATRRGRVQEGGDVCPTLTAAETGVHRIESNVVLKNQKCRKHLNNDNSFLEKTFGVTLFESDKFGGWKVNREELSPTLRAEKVCAGTVVKTDLKYRIRKLTPKECWRLMAFSDEDFHKAEAVNSNTQLYKQAGNSIVVSVLEAIFRQMHIQNVETWNEIQNRNI